MGKIVITGTGRCGTSFLMHLFTALGFNTGYNLDECEQHIKRSGCYGGIEHSTGTERFEKADIVKNPEWFYKPELLDFDIDYLIVPIRSISDVAKSRELVGSDKYGGFWQGATNQSSQIRIDQKAFYEFMEFIIRKDLKVIFFHFPRIIKEPYYLYKNLYNTVFETMFFEVLPDFQYFETIFNQIADPEKVHI